MGHTSNESNALDARVNSALQDFLERTDRGENVDQEQFLAGHPEIADQLRSFILDAADLAHRAVIDSIPSAEVSTNQSVSETIAPQSSAGLPALPEVFGRYRLQRLLGRGAMGAVYLAQDTQLSRKVAIKVPTFHHDQSDEILQRFYIEARAAATLRNPHICPVYDVGEIAGWHYISMAYIEGHSLSDVIKANGAQPERQVLLLIRKLALALQEAHNQGIIHRDLKPGNVMLDTRGEPVVMDFGLACQTREGAERITASGVILGSPAYMPPEQLEGNSAQISPAADQYALGVILYELLTGELPFRGSISAVISQIITKPAPSPRLLRPDLDLRVEALCLQMLSKTPEVRLESMKAVADRIVAILKQPLKAGATEATKATIPSVPTNATASKKKEAVPNAGAVTITPASAKPAPAKEINDATESGTHHQKISTLCLLAAKLIRKHDYDQACRILSSIPSESRTDELTEMLDNAEEKSEESRLLLKDIEHAIRNDQPKDLPALVRRFLQLKPGNKAMQTLAKELQEFGAERVIRTRRSRSNFLDPAGRVWNPVHIAGYLIGLAVLCVIVYMQAVAFQTKNGIVIIEVHDPRVTVSFANDEITATSSGKKYHLKATDKKALQLEVDGVTVDSSTQEISVAQNETKLISARLVDGRLDLLINSQKKTFAVPTKATIDQDIATKDVSKIAVNHTSLPAKAPVNEWVDLLAAVDPTQASGRTIGWKREGSSLVGKALPDATSGWLVLVPPPKITGDYDLELDLLVVDSEYIQVGLPLNDTIITASFGKPGTALHWIDGKDLNWANNPPPHGNSKLSLKKGVLQHIKASVRHQGAHVTVETELDGELAGRYAGLRSRVSTPKETGPRPDQMKLVALVNQRSNDHRMEVHKARVRLLTQPQPGSEPIIEKPGSESTVKDSWTQLLNGNDITGWTPMVSSKEGPEFQKESTGGWTVRNGELICETDAPGWLRLDKPYGDCEIQFECFLPGGTNSGLLVRFPGLGSIYEQKDCEIQLENDPTQARPEQKCGAVYGLVGPSQNAFRPEEWNSVSVVLRDGKLRVRLNNQQVVDTNLADHQTLRALPAAGYFGLANHISRAKGCRFRNIRVKEFASAEGHTAGAVKPSAPMAPNPVTSPEKVLLDVDFRKNDGGFSIGDGSHLMAEHRDGEYRYLGKLLSWQCGGLHPVFWSDENSQLRDVAVEVDVRIVGRKKGMFAIEFGRVGKLTYSLCLNESGQMKLIRGFDIDVVPWAPVSNLRPIDQFNTLRVAVENKTVRVSVNGRQLFEKRLERYTGGPVCLWVCSEEVPFDTRIQRVRLERLKQPEAIAYTSEVRRFKGHQDIVRAVAFLPDGQQAVSVGHGQAFKLWNVATGELLFDFVGHTANVTSVSVSGNGRRALTGCDDHHLRLWDLEARTLLKTLKGHESEVVNVVLSSDGASALSSSLDGQIRNWDVKSGKSKLVPNILGGPTLAVSPNKKVFAIGQAEGKVLLGALQGVAPLVGHSHGDVDGVSFTPDGTKLVTGSEDGTMRLWNLEDGKEINRLETESVGFTTVTVTSNSRYAIAGSRDQTILAWDLQTGDKILAVQADKPVTHRLAISPDNQYVLSGGGDRYWKLTNDFDLRLWKLPSPPAQP